MRRRGVLRAVLSVLPLLTGTVVRVITEVRVFVIGGCMTFVFGFAFLLGPPLLPFSLPLFLPLPLATVGSLFIRIAAALLTTLRPLRGPFPYCFTSSACFITAISASSSASSSSASSSFLIEAYINIYRSILKPWSNSSGWGRRSGVRGQGSEGGRKGTNAGKRSNPLLPALYRKTQKTKCTFFFVTF